MWSTRPPNVSSPSLQQAEMCRKQASQSSSWSEQAQVSFNEASAGGAASAASARERASKGAASNGAFVCPPPAEHAMSSKGVNKTRRMGGR